MTAAVTKLVEGGDQTFKMVFKFGTLRLAEVELGESIAAVFTAGSEKLGLDTVSALFWAVLQPSHRMTRERSDDLIDELGLKVVLPKLLEGVAEYFGDGEASDETGEAGNAQPKTKKTAKSKS